MAERARNAQLTGFGLAALLLVLVGAFVIAIAMRFVDGAQQRQRTHDAISAIESVQRVTLTAVAAQNAFLLTDDRDARTRYWAASQDARHALDGLQRELDPASTPALATLQTALNERFAISDAIVERHQAEGLAASQPMVGDGATAPIDRRLDAAFASILQRERDRLVAQTEAAERSAQWLLIAASLGIPLSLLILGVVYQMLRREIETRRKAELAADASHCELNTSVEQLTRVSRDMQRLSSYASLLQSCDNAEEALSITEVSLAALLPDTAGTVYLLRNDEDGERAEVAAEWGDHVVPSAPTPAAHDCWAMRRVQPFPTDPSTAELRCSHVDHDAAVDTGATLCIPLNAATESLGLLYLSGSAPLPSETLAVTAAEQLSMALANLRMKETLRNQSIRDPLTGLYNRRFLEESLAREYARCTRKQAPLSVLMLDVDHFKKFNDSFGHPGGDALLAAVGKLLRTTSRAGDIPCRFGGEEFTVIMPETDLDGAIARAEEIRLAIEAMIVHHEGKPLARVTASLGASVYPHRAATIESLLETADQALYQAKAGGRNRVLGAPLPA